MRVLRLAQYIINPNYPQHAKNDSGYGRSVWDICRYSSQNGNEEYLYTYSNLDTMSVEGVNFIDGNHRRLLRYSNLETFLGLFKMFPIAIKLKGNDLRTRIAYFMYSSSYGYIQHIIEKVKPDVIHIHGLTYATLPFVRAAIESDIPFVVTLHGLNMEITQNKLERNFEIEQIKNLNKKGVYITIIGSGMYKQICEKCSINNTNSIVTINHGIDPSSFDTNQSKEELQKSFGIQNKKVIVSVGSLSKRKNHSGLIRAVSLLTKDEKAKTVVFIVGEGPLRSKLEREIKDLDLSDVIYLVGRKNSKELSRFYSIADITIMLSDIEGFGRPILESYLFGVPVLVFKDLEAVDDLYKEGSMFLINERTDDAVVAKIREVLNTKINPGHIVNHALTKTWDSAVNEYIKVYKKAVKNGNHS